LKTDECGGFWLDRGSDWHAKGPLRSLKLGEVRTFLRPRIGRSIPDQVSLRDVLEPCDISGRCPSTWTEDQWRRKASASCVRISRARSSWRCPRRLAGRWCAAEAVEPTSGCPQSQPRRALLRNPIAKLAESSWLSQAG
jgi:hypothetical protein